MTQQATALEGASAKDGLMVLEGTSAKSASACASRVRHSLHTSDDASTWSPANDAICSHRRSQLLASASHRASRDLWRVILPPGCALCCSAFGEDRRSGRFASHNVPKRVLKGGCNGSGFKAYHLGLFINLD